MSPQGGSNNRSSGGGNTSTPASSAIAASQAPAASPAPSPPPYSSKSKVPPQRWVKRYRTEVSASLSSAISTACAFPLDSVKTRMQTYKYDGFTDCLRHTYANEGLRGFFRGVTAPLASVTIVRTISFSIYQRAKYIYSDWLSKNFGFDVLKHVNTHGTYPNLWSVACFGAAGATAGSCITVIAYPIDSAKSIYQRNALLYSKGQKVKPVKIHFFQRQMYRGLGVSMTRSCVLNAIFFSSFEFWKKRIDKLEDKPGW
ncbi:mitochondrial carrier protein [Sporothrix brasiliensis 5110]|uniref:Mitochondrial carrier protein n=1 Tax=Sporothrix brasiliensis 5110 TaxID=1398154 RepID=A0A0C2FW25_9PEZI|nr:mitochondrial carrier protein [Sporothrix brasiliensis 5110]KIH95208.1 mitochondrial carrier protein [Sporothrix brasiliensis 5110]